MKKKLPKKFLKLVEILEKIPTVGKKSALRIAYYLTLKNRTTALNLAYALEDMVVDIKKCKICNNISDDEICSICLDETRLNYQLCIVSSVNDLYIIEDLNQYNGKYFILEDINDLNIEEFKELIINHDIREIIFAFSPSYHSDSIILFIEDFLKDFDISFSKIAQGVPTGVRLENIDTMSVMKSFQSRVKI
jgi:recombination protein RecR